MYSKQNVEVLGEPIKSATDKKVYKTIKLENGLTALLISDPSTLPDDEDEESSATEDSQADLEYTSDELLEAAAPDVPHLAARKGDKHFNEEKMAACALCVNVGYFSDPQDIQGLAHFVEHMVFMGSEKYPKENEFDSFIKRKGGSTNASTDCEATTFYFEIPEKHLAPAMDMFSQFFVSPLMLKDAMQREREAIESEFAIGAPSDMNRKDQLLFSLFPAGHPAHTFPWGNLKSLREDLYNDDEKLYRAAHDFRRRHYSAHRMTVAVQARLDLNSLERYVVNAFGVIPSNGLPGLNFTSHTYTLRSPVFLSGVYFVKPLSDVTELQLTWCLHPLVKEYESKNDDYISFILGHEGAGSLLSYLKKKVWALGIYTGDPMGYSSMFSLFTIEVELTSLGLKHIDEVLEAIFSYINMLTRMGPSERLYKEIKSINETSFRFHEEWPPVENVVGLCESMQLFAPQHYITGARLYYKYDPEGLNHLMMFLRPERANIMIMSNEHSETILYNAKERWFGTMYRRENTPPCWLKRWMLVEPYPSYHLPEPNIYITTNFDLIEPNAKYLDVAYKTNIDVRNESPLNMYKKMKASDLQPQTLTHGNLTVTIDQFRLDQPNLLRKNDRMEVWYKPDFKFLTPTAALYFYFITYITYNSTLDSCLLDLWKDALEQDLKEKIYPAVMADLWHVIFVEDGITVEVNGYNQNLYLVVGAITRSMRSCVDRLTGEMLEALKSERVKSYHNLLSEPHVLAKDLRMAIMLDPYISPRDKAEAMTTITLEQLMAFGDRFLNRMYLQVLVQGNIAWYDAISISDKVLSDVKWDSIPPDRLPQVSVRELPVGERVVRARSYNPASTNSVITNYYQAGAADLTTAAIIEILMMLMEEPVFDQLRTKEQLGYSVFAMMRHTFGVLGFSVSVNTQADKFSVSYVDGRIEAFLQNFGRRICEITDTALDNMKQSLVHLKYTADLSLLDEAERNWSEIVSREYKFHRLFDEAEAIATVKSHDIKTFIENYLTIGMPNYRKLSIQIEGHIQEKDNQSPIPPYRLTLMDSEQNRENKTENNNLFITNIDEFRRNLPIVYLLDVASGCRFHKNTQSYFGRGRAIVANMTR